MTLNFISCLLFLAAHIFLAVIGRTLFVRLLFACAAVSLLFDLVRSLKTIRKG